MSDDTKVLIDGHAVDPHLVDYFFDGETGRRITDEEWDEQRRRMRAGGCDPFEKTG